ncbi:glutamyl-tRNA synthetase [Pseudopedobacter saltans DSM 12145]|uniref:Glutamate--tRNA ligase n=1 Tax=Pseudopedobacter saltans (strain ATCC 51119 / DSM 12145 / JCM 21818 / CCUG 39354 / LMG 10337 / NBRC 100064 / NCIMB 13643) TaxID=762903 RepID=F0S7W3_PSESL|nr:glutamate--tRNA ligase [Pseudopedobacter saltans]ADY53368.1 glutamyl-tRNA synthetase [Pseudopedobacter saltans DSM 12145]
MDKKVRVRFAPSPTGGLHIGGVRTILFNYIFAKKNNGEFVLRIEDTDQTRYVPGAEEYIINCLKWCGLNPGEGPNVGGEYAPYRQSERKPIYKKYADELIKNGYAYYAFDTPEELENARNTIENFRYDKSTRMTLRNSLTLSAVEVEQLLTQGVPYVVRIKVPEDQNIHFVDLIRGHVSFDSNEVDDKVLLKADGMPTYHLAVVVDDYLMKITHAFRGEEWLPSSPIHILLWKYLGWEKDMPEWAHLPLILKPDGHGKLSKRDGQRLGFPVYAMNWTDPVTKELAAGFKEVGFLPEAFLNMLAMLGWNDGTDQELFSLEELCEKFSLERVNKSGAKFDYEKAKWFNGEWIKKSSAQRLYPYVKEVFKEKGISVTEEQLVKVIDMVKERCILLPDFYQQASFFFEAPQQYDIDAVKPKWNADKAAFFDAYIKHIEAGEFIDAAVLETEFKQLAADKGLKIGEVMLPFRIMLVGGKFGPQVFDIALALGKEETIRRIQTALPLFQ